MNHFEDIGCGDGGCHPHIPELEYEEDLYNFQGILKTNRRNLDIFI